MTQHEVLCGPRGFAFGSLMLLGLTALKVRLHGNDPQLAPATKDSRNFLPPPFLNNDMCKTAHLADR